MALKSKGKVEVKHEVLNNDVEALNDTVAMWISNGWRIVDAKCLNVDWHNKQYAIFYILERGVKDEVEA